MSALRPLVDERARRTLDAIDMPISVTTSVRDRDARLLDFRLEFVNVAAARWAGLDRDSMIGRLATDLLPGLRPTGLFDELLRVVMTGTPFRQTGYFDGSVEEGRAFAGTFDLLAVRHGDGYLSAWNEAPGSVSGDVVDPLRVETAVEQARAAVPLVRLEASSGALRLRTAL